MDYSSLIQSNLNNLAYFVPELLLVGVIITLIIADLFLGKQRSAWMSILALAGCVVVLFAVIAQYDGGSRSLFSDMLVVDPFSLFFKLLFLASTILVIFLSIGSIELAGRAVGEYFVLLLILMLGMFFMASATNIVTIFISIEMVSIVSFVLAAYLKTRRRSSEAGLKYAIYGAFSSGLMLYGISILYGLTGTFNIYEIGAILAKQETSGLALTVSILLMLGGFGYKIAAVPFHFWSPDVYEGAPTPVTALLSVGPKAAGFAVLIRFFNVALTEGNANGAVEWLAIHFVNWPQLLAVIAAATMTLGNLLAIQQQNIKRLLAYSSIAHAGYALMGVVVLTEQGVFATLFYLAVYYIMNIGAFLIVIIFQDVVGSERIDDWKGLAWKAPVPAIIMGIFLFSLTGLPPTAGFIGKFYLFAAVINKGSGFYWLAIVGLLNSVVALYYYARILKTMFFDRLSEDETTSLSISPYYLTLLIVLAVPTILLGLYWAPLADLTGYSVQFLRTL